MKSLMKAQLFESFSQSRGRLEEPPIVTKAPTELMMSWSLSRRCPLERALSELLYRSHPKSHEAMCFVCQRRIKKGLCEFSERERAYVWIVTIWISIFCTTESQWSWPQHTATVFLNSNALEVYCQWLGDTLNISEWLNEQRLVFVRLKTNPSSPCSILLGALLRFPLSWRLAFFSFQISFAGMDCFWDGLGTDVASNQTIKCSSRNPG